ncbi:RNA-binding domain superfamily [Arabidopsis suecica]|uniref:RNA-binding domain superfamily n=1 Tax=Arabidopsis suecica TaxID=45249 RepID=A0A8T2H247_ARASU|nr:RNA-binding domain superfamily [Arabidopsis suecica]
MDEFVNKGLELNGSDAADIPKSGSVCRISVEGYDTSVHAFDVELTLRKHFSSCGEVKNVNVPEDFVRGILKRCAYICIVGECALEKALQLSGSDVRGWTISVQASPFHRPMCIDPGRALVAVAYLSRQEYRMMVTGYDTSLPELDIQIGLCKHFSTCGEVTGVLIPGDRRTGGLNSKALVTVVGEGAAEKARELSGCDVKGWDITVVGVTDLGAKRNRSSSCTYIFALILGNKLLNLSLVWWFLFRSFFTYEVESSR